MAKRKPKEKCEHGNSLVYMTGCPHCVFKAMNGLTFCRSFGVEIVDIIAVLRRHYTTDTFTVAVNEEKAKREARDGKA